MSNNRQNASRFNISFIRQCGMWLGLGCGLGENIQGTISDEFGLGRGPWAWVSSRAWGGGRELTWRAVYGQKKRAVGLAVGQQLY
ncbi:hypothetical protein HanRHA438_Chr04g0176911 [Helianthus annuus]|uniref:Uncharacterized protein n=1 Tax=Helianthus annuus TaxID=4232 RepID=A0A251UZN6_HELAN|nr:hypothetical protein HanXRQr2_Chr04g0167171 [Helianthus annuus]KAJ0581112.1 hypothetical protein HanHA300_Chr04g0137231 [Helianthus annuus]KAJ0588942.1 hypothetical protein HanIR_Chr04g0180511 [Helianthus annuus]KAJ0597059.1 hypothetical protein HanHA89_Chr04g0150191 [Helianthus annuus]KAJ0757741.1 hypothetical protein HanLR1_Chr04g0142301 [Helianthus annuus]